MDFNVKKLASDAGVFFTRAVQVRPDLPPAAGGDVWTDLLLGSHCIPLGLELDESS